MRACCQRRPSLFYSPSRKAGGRRGAPVRGLNRRRVVACRQSEEVRKPMRGFFPSQHPARRERQGWRLRWLAGVVAVAVALWGGAAVARKGRAPRAPPGLLRDTGLYTDFGQRLVD